MNYRDWTDRVRLFSESLRRLPGDIEVSIEIAPPVSQRELDELSPKWPTGIPESLRKLWTEGSAQINCPYYWEPPSYQLAELKSVFDYNNYIYGGARFYPPNEVFPGNSGAEIDDLLVRETLGKFGQELWCRSAVFLHVGNGDCLGLDPESNSVDPRVAYLLHDGEETDYIADSFSEFLATWEEVSYIGPEIWLLDYWIDPATQRIDPNRYKTGTLRKLLTP